MPDNSIKLSIVLPCYNEAENLPLLLERYKSAWEDLPAELILVNNGSTDNTAEVLEKELAKLGYEFARTVIVPKNVGYGHGINTGLRATKGEFVGFSHADMQCDSADLFRAYKEINELEDPKSVIIKGKREWRGLNSAILTGGMSVVASTVLMRKFTDINAQPKVFHRSLLEKLTKPPNGFEFDLYVLYTAIQNGMEIKTIPVVFGERAHGQSKWAFSFISRYKTIWSMIRYIFNLRFEE